MNWWKPVEKVIVVSLLSGAAGALAYLMAHLGETGCPPWALPVVQALLTGVAAAIANILKHWSDPTGGA